MRKSFGELRTTLILTSILDTLCLHAPSRNTLMASISFQPRKEERTVLMEEEGHFILDVNERQRSGVEHLHLAKTSMARYLVIVLVFMATLLSTAVLLNMPSAGSSQDGSAMSIRQHEKTHDQCGSTPDEAVKRDCRFDVMSFSWLPIRCFDSQLTDEFLALHDWHWYLDTTGKQEVPAKQVELGTQDKLFVTWEYHLNHCTYMWKKLHRAMLHEGPIDSYIGNYNHTLHCTKVLEAEGVPADEKDTYIFIKYPACI